MVSCTYSGIHWIYSQRLEANEEEKRVVTESTHKIDLFPYKSPPADEPVNRHGVKINREQV